jgi:hypothetical protein
MTDVAVERSLDGCHEWQDLGQSERWSPPVAVAAMLELADFRQIAVIEPKQVRRLSGA